MKVKELITILLDMDMNKDIAIEYPNDSGLIVGNYCRYKEAEDFDVFEYKHGVVIGVEKWLLNYDISIEDYSENIISG